MTRSNYSVYVDFDGVIHSYTSGWVSAAIIPDPPVEGAIEWLNEMVKHFHVAIFTTRATNSDARRAIQNWLEVHGFKGDVTITATKGPALVYIDDRGWRFEGRFPSKQEIHLARPWWKSPT